MAWEWLNSKVSVMLVKLFLIVAIVVSVLLGVSAVVSTFNGTYASADLHATLNTDGWNVAVVVVLLVIATGGSLFWAQELNESNHQVY